MPDILVMGRALKTSNYRPGVPAGYRNALKFNQAAVLIAAVMLAFTLHNEKEKNNHTPKIIF